MGAEFHYLEESLKEFLIEAQDDAYNSKKINFYRYNNLKVSMDNKKNSEPHFTVRVGISEATFSLDNCEKMDGGLANDEKYVYRWFEKPHVRAELSEAWIKTVKFEPVTMVNPEDL